MNMPLHTVQSGHTKSALVVDDDDFSQENICEKLRMLGLGKVYSANNGRSAIRALDQMRNPPELIICDIFMPDMDGIEFLGELAKRGYQGGLILVTGVNETMMEVAQDIAAANNLRVLGAFTKPLLLHTLANTLRVLIE